MSRTKVTTLQDLENTDDELLVNAEHYKQMQLLIRRHQSKINSLLEKEEMDEMQITILNEQLETVANLARELKKQIGETNVSKETLKDSMKKHRANFKNIEDSFQATYGAIQQ